MGRTLRRAATVTGAAALLVLAGSGVAMAQEPPVANCDPFSSLICQLPVNIGPFNIDIGSIFAPPAATP